MRTEARPPRRKWPWIVTGAAIAALVVAGGIWYAANLPDKAPILIGTPSPVTPPPSSDDVQPTGCMGGDIRDAAMVLAAQKAAPHTSNGAVEFAAAFVRWMGQFPVPTQEEAGTIQSAVVAPDSEYDLPAFLAKNPNVSGSLVPDETPFYVSTVPGVWNLESYSDDSARVSIGTGIVINGELHPTFRLSSTYTLEWGNAGWMVLEANQPRPTEELFPLGSGFTEGC